MKKRIMRTVILCLFLVLLTGQSVFAAAPKMKASITEKNILALMDAYDQDGAYLLRTMSKSGDAILVWWQGCNTIVEGIDTGVHEEFHGYSRLKAPWKSEDIYIGGKKYIRVKSTDVFRSKKMSTSIPKKLRTFRWSTYIGDPIANLDSDVNGVYGLLNEFTAYYWGMHAQMSLYDYYKKNKATPAQWRQFINSGANNRLAYAEFKYYMKQYLVYAKKHNRSVYNGIVRNTSFVKAYQTIEKKFAAQITKFEKQMKDIGTLLKKDGHAVEIGEYYYIDGYGTGIFQQDYDNLTRELKKAAYQNILRSSSTVTVGTTAITSLKSTEKGAKLQWKKASGAKGYYVYRKAKGEKSYKKVKTTSGLAWTDTSVKRGRTYSYKIIPYTKSGSKVTKGKGSAVKSVTIPAVGTTAVTSLKSTEKGAKLQWKKASGAKGYYVYRKAKGEKSYKKVKTTSGLAWTDTSVKRGRTYSYKIMPYTKSGSKVIKGKSSAGKSIALPAVDEVSIHKLAA